MTTYNNLTVEQARVIFSQLPDDLRRVGAGVHFTLSEESPDFGALTVPDSAASLVGPIVAATPADAVLTPTKADLVAYAASKRFAVETGGIVVNGAQIDTSRESQSMIANAFAYVQASGAASVEYKTASGWVTMDAPTVKAVALAVGAHVQACFAAEQAVDAAISAGTITTTAQIDSAAWPA